MDLLELLAPIGAKKSIRDRLRRAHDDSDNSEQTGDGVLTRKQAKILADSTSNKFDQESNSNIPPSDDVQMQDNNDFDFTKQEEPEMPSTSEQLLPEKAPASPVPGPSQGSDQTSDEHEEVLESHLFDKETLVAENEDLKAYVIKTYFRKIKNFE